MSGQYYNRIDTPVGPVYLVLKGRELAAVSIWEEPRGIRRGNIPVPLARQFDGYFEGTLREFNYPLAITGGTGFEQKIWMCLLEIPYGQTRSYKWIAEHAGRPGASRAAGQALSKNPLPIILPCHRVIKSGGAPGGYSPSPGIKRRLLDMEYYYTLRSGAHMKKTVALPQPV